MVKFDFVSEQTACTVYVSLIYSIFLICFSGSSVFWLYCGAVLLDKGPHVLRDW